MKGHSMEYSTFLKGSNIAFSFERCKLLQVHTQLCILYYAHIQYELFLLLQTSLIQNNSVNFIELFLSLFLNEKCKSV